MREPTTRRRGRRAVAVVVPLLVTVAGCSGGTSLSDRATGAGAVVAAAGSPTAAATPDVPQARITVTPGDGAGKIRPDAVPTVQVAAGRLATVRVLDDEGQQVRGALTPDGTAWKAAGRLRLDTTYAVTATAFDAAQRVTKVTSRFSTITPRRSMRARVTPLDGSTVGVGMPFVVYLTAPARDRAAVERRLKVTASRPVVGSWHWFSDTEVHYRPKTYWPAGTDVTVQIPLDGLEVGDGVWGDQDRTVRFHVAAAMVSTVDVDAHTLTVTRNGQVLRTIPVSTGRRGFLTRNGIKVISEKYLTKTMDAATTGIKPGDPNYYRVDNVRYAMRVTNSGEFLHAAPWSAGAQGSANVSHGCVGMSTANARWLFELTRPGDVVKVVGSPRPLEQGNGWTDWNLSWASWVMGSALS